MRRLGAVMLFVACRLGFDAGGDDTGPTADAAMPPGDAGTCIHAPCAAAGGTCTGAVCQIVSTSENVVQCPAGMPCRLVCDGYRFCRDGARCGGATWCDVACIGYRACQDGVDCGASECVVRCNGEEACEVGITASGACTSHCCGIDACLGGTGTCTTDNTCS